MTKREFVRETSWMDDAACKGQGEDFYPPEERESNKESAERQARAVEICGRCTVRAECLEFALVNNEKFGVWGGVTARDRQRIRSQARFEESA